MSEKLSDNDNDRLPEHIKKLMEIGNKKENANTNIEENKNMSLKNDSNDSLKSNDMELTSLVLNLVNKKIVDTIDNKLQWFTKKIIDLENQLNALNKTCNNNSTPKTDLNKFKNDLCLKIKEMIDHTMSSIN